MTKGENNEKIMELAQELPESDAPTVNIGSGEIAGGGYKGEDDIKVSRKAQKSYKRKTKEGAGRQVLGFKAFTQGKAD